MNDREHIIEVTKKCKFKAVTKDQPLYVVEATQLEAFAQQIRNEALKEAAEKCAEKRDSYEARGFPREFTAARALHNAILAMIKEVKGQ